jgi:quinol monooxygenase YgiN
MVVVISKENSNAVAIIRFEVEPQRQQALVNAAINNTEKVMKRKPGFISASIHKSLAGTRVVNYAQWKSAEIYHNNISKMITSDEMTEVRRPIDQLATSSDLNIYELESTSGKHNITISKNNDVTTLINFFSVKRENQQKLIDVWIEFAEKVRKKQPGVISGNLHRSFDGTRLVNYAQCETKEDIIRMWERPELKPWFDKHTRLAEDVTPDFYDVVYTSD